MHTHELDIINPVSLNPRVSTAADVAEAILWQHKRFGVRRFAFFALSKGWRSIGYPPREEYIKCAEMAKEVQNLVRDYDLEFGWFMALTVKSGAAEAFTAPVRRNGTRHPFASCPLDPAFRKRLASDIAAFAEIARPSFIFTEDDFSLKALGGACFCEGHLEAFAKRTGRYYTREELLEAFSKDTPEAYALLREWRALLRDTLVLLAKSIREELDKVDPEIKLGCMQPGGMDYDGDATEAVARAMAGEGHTPYSRLYGTFYAGVDVKRIPEELYHPLYSKQHMGDNFKFYHESDPFPHNKFYTAGQHMKAMSGTVYSYGFDGAIFFMSGFDLRENVTETAYGDMYAKEVKRWNEVYRIAKQCTLRGAEIDYDPFWNTADTSVSTVNPLWVGCVSRFGIPYTTTDAEVAFWDVRQAKHADHDMVMQRLSRGLLLDGDAAKCLCQRGYGKYLGVEIGEDVIAGTNLLYDLGACEIVKKEAVGEAVWSKMPPAHMFSPAGSGKWLKMNVTNEKCEVISEAFSFLGERITPAMTRFENELGGRVIVMSLTLDGNRSQALFNYTRQGILQKLLAWCSDEYVYVKNIPDIHVIMNEGAASDFIGMLTMTNLCVDPVEKAELHLPPKWKRVQNVRILDKEANWIEVPFEKTENEIKIYTEFAYCEPVYILFS